jgi:hypothetical protein
VDLEDQEDLEVPEVLVGLEDLVDQVVKACMAAMT